MSQVTFQRTNIYKDFDLSFSRHPLTNDVGVKNDINSINQAIRNLVNTNFYERPFRPRIGCNIRALLFQPADPITIDDIRQAISDTIGNHEPRVQLINVEVTDNSGRNAYNVKVIYKINTEQNPITLDTVLKRLR